MPAKKKALAKKTATAKPKPKATPAPPPAPKPAGSEVKIAAAKGRPMLQWVGKRPLRSVTAFPAQHFETFDPLGSGEPGGLLYHGDNKEVLAHLLASGFRGKVNLVCLDLPFDSAAALTDLPEKKSDFVEGRYTLPAPKGETNVAVKITDMLGEEVVVQKRV